MELRHLRYFVAVAEAENVSRAALKLHVSQPGISRQIRDLEAEIGFSLFERSAKSVRLTAAGKVLLDEARAVLAHTEAAVEKARAAAGGTNSAISVGYAPSLTVQLLSPALRKFQEQCPKVHVALHDLSTEEMLAQLGRRELQVVLTVRPPPKLLRGLGFTELARYDLSVAVSPRHRLAKLKSVSLEQIAREPLITYSRQDYPEYHKMLDGLFAPTGGKPRIAGEQDSVTSLIAAVEAGRGIALVPSCLACMVGPRLMVLPLKPASEPLVVGAVYRADAETDLVKKFIAAAMPTD